MQLKQIEHECRDIFTYMLLQSPKNQVEGSMHK